MRILDFLLVAGIAAGPVAGQNKISLDSMDRLELLGVKAETARYRGRHALHVVEQDAANGTTMAMVKGTDFKDGVIEIEVAGALRPGAMDAARGFVGVAFRIQPHGDKYECFYLRPTNGRADDQLRRNHSVQYVSEPEFPWQRLRKENPGVYESYADLEPGVWTRMKILVSGTKARLYVNGAEQPVLIVNDLKLGENRGGVGLWIGPGTDGYFSNLTIQ